MAEALPDYPDSDFSEDDLSPLDMCFNKAADHVRKLTSKLDNTQLLELYGLYKQGTEGTCDAPKPGWLDGRGRRKWEAWRAHGDMPCEEAKEKYISLVQKHAPELTDLSPDNDSGIKEAWVAVSSMRKSPEPELIHNELTILDAARENCAERVTELLTKFPDLCYEKDEDGLTALHWAADRNSTKALQAAIKGGCPIDASDESGQTALHYAVSCGHTEATKILINAGATLLKDEDGCSPLDMVDNEEIRKILEGAKLS